jgi:hypothetical protein
VPSSVFVIHDTDRSAAVWSASKSILLVAGRKGPTMSFRRGSIRKSAYGVLGFANIICPK